MEGIGLIQDQPTHVIMGTRWEGLVGEEEPVRNQGIGMDGLNIAIVNIFSVPS